TFTGGYEKLAGYMAANGADAGILVHEVCVKWLGTFGGILAILGVIAAPITTGDTAMRSLRLIIADSIGLQQKKFIKRLLVTLPIVGVSYLLININFDILWRYFAWCNQTLSIFTLWACSVWLARNNKAYLITMIPAMFMTMLCVTFICYAPMGSYVEGVGLPMLYSEAVGFIAMAVCTFLFFQWKRQRAANSMLATD
ncbi:MAG: carbon starvation protein A, partial [Muribaculaceae bacterium]|nr:carbon starvation protein A [Muribaculaceae bacterium]